MTGVPDELADRIRVDELRRHGITVGSEFGTWNATVPQEDGERSLTRHSLPALLDDVDKILAGGDPRARPG